MAALAHGNVNPYLSPQEVAAELALREFLKLCALVDGGASPNTKFDVIGITRENGDLAVIVRPEHSSCAVRVTVK
jgi:hypothetical protein